MSSKIDIIMDSAAARVALRCDLFLSNDSVKAKRDILLWERIYYKIENK